MNLLVISHKECWRDPADSTQFVTGGGFPMQMHAISMLFDSTELLITEHQPPLPEEARRLEGEQLSVRPMPAPAGQDLQRKLSMLIWLPRFSVQLWRRIAQAEAIHALVPGDIGMLGVLFAALQRKRLFVRHCGTWDEPVTTSGRILMRLLKRVAGGQTVVMATGGNTAPPSIQAPSITWIHSTSLTAAEIAAVEPSRPWDGNEGLNLVMAGRVSRGKNMEAIIRALPAIRAQLPKTTLTLLGDGQELKRLRQVAAELGVSGAVDFRGNVDHDEVLETLQRNHLFVFPTKVKEGFPKAVLEAMACGLPVIATGVSVLPHLIGTQCGIILESPTPEAVAEAVLSITTDPEQMAQMGRNARERSKQYTLESWRTLIQTRLEKAWGQPLKRC